MNIQIKVILFIFVFLIPTSLFALDKDTLWSAITFADNPASTKEATALALANPDILKEVLFISDFEKDNSVARGNAIIILLSCSVNNTVSREQFFKSVFSLLSRIEDYVHPSRLIGEKAKISMILGNYGFDTANKRFYLSLEVAFSSLLTEISSMQEQGLIKSYDLAKNLKTKIESAKRSYLKKSLRGVKASITQVETALAELSAQTGRNISEEALQILTKFCKNILTALNSSPIE